MVIPLQTADSFELTYPDLHHGLPGLRSLRQIGLSAFAPATEGALAKLGRVLPEALRESIRTVEDVVAIEPGPWVVSTSVEQLIRAASAIRSGKRIRFAYRSHDGTASRRQIEPYAVMHTDGRWYLIGHCLSRRALRTFRLDRVTDLELCSATFRRPASFDPHSYLQDRMPFIQSDYQIDVWINMPIEEAESTFCPVESGHGAAGGRYASALRARSAGNVRGHATQHGTPHRGLQSGGTVQHISPTGVPGDAGRRRILVPLASLGDLPHGSSLHRTRDKLSALLP